MGEASHIPALTPATCVLLETATGCPVRQSFVQYAHEANALTDGARSHRMLHTHTHCMHVRVACCTNVRCLANVHPCRCMIEGRKAKEARSTLPKPSTPRSTGTPLLTAPLCPAGGADAKPFVTYHNALERNYTLRIAT